VAIAWAECRLAIDPDEFTVGDVGHRALPAANASLKRFLDQPRDHGGNTLMRATPLADGANSCSQSSVAFPNSSIPSQPSDPWAIAQMRSSRTFTNGYLFLPSTRGTRSGEKC